MSWNLRALLSRLWRNERGGIALMTGLAMTSLIGMAAFVVDLGYVMNARAQLQAATDAAALAGAKDINCCTSSKAAATATGYGATAGSLNANSKLSVTMAAGYPQLKCLTSTGVSCTGTDSANAIVVKQNATVPLHFGPVIGISTVDISATSTAGVNGGPPASYDVMIVLDTTYSMNNPDPNCTVSGISNPTRLDCALDGVRALLSGLWPSVDQVGVMIFPGLTSTGQVPYEYDCSDTPKPTIAKYNNNPIYQIIGLSTDYRSSDKAASLNTASNLVKAARGGASGCQNGIDAQGGVGTYYANALTAAQDALTNNGRSGVRKVIILLSDGDANASVVNMFGYQYANQCHQAITVAQNAAAAGTWVYSIAYGASTSATGSCSTDSPRISACATMQQIASDPSKFYSDTSGGSSNCTSPNSVGKLNDIFNHIVGTLTSSRLLPDNTM